ncbi:MAG: tRNA 2-thiouridine(34) synthase MnmA, partial [bacterium]|nr:tRNA 2-thiouridine(34) synthase MnmA [bacterium]
DASEEYKRGVIDYLLSEYRVGRTPNPDVMCNREVKFGAFYRFAKEKGADFIATGHYARANNGTLLRGVDVTKDQSYFLWAVPKDALQMTLFPLGGLKKDVTRSRAQKYGLPNATKKDSQGICFLGSISVEDFLRSEFGSEPGEAVDTTGAFVGTHSGALLHTLGARISLENARPGPWYVVQKDIEKNQLIVSRERNIQSNTDSLRLTDTNWLSEDTDDVLSAQFRYHGPVIEGTLSGDRKEFKPSLLLPEPLASGQSLVLYRGEELLGGGILTI